MRIILGSSVQIGERTKSCIIALGIAYWDLSGDYSFELRLKIFLAVE